MLLRSVVATLIDTVAMTLSSATEMHLRGRDESVVPGKAVGKLLGLVGVPQPQGRALRVLSTWTHWAYGTAWGVVFWFLVDVAALPLAVAAVAFLFIVWGTALLELPALGLTPPFWNWGAKEVGIDFWHHVAYTGGTVLGWVLLGQVGG
jgi:uncharacterized membrane protein YagU involved in acid resistance